MRSIVNRRLASLFVLVWFATASVAEARPGGGGRSMGFRGYRGFGTRTAPTAPAPYRYQGGQQGFGGTQQQPYTAPPQRPMGGGSFARGLMGGLAGGVLGSMLFGGMTRAGGFGGGGGMGLLDLLALGGLAYLVFRWISGRRRGVAAGGAGGRAGMTHYEKLRSVEPGPYAAQASATANAPAGATAAGEQLPAETLARYNAAFDLEAFKEERMDDFMNLQAAWNHRDLSRVSGLVAPELRNALDSDIADLKSQGRINRVDNIAVRATELVEAWQERGMEYATVRFRANVVDYVVDERSGEVVSGDQFAPVKFEEDWTFVRPIDGSDAAWKISAIES